jgi:hypothetical protein
MMADDVRGRWVNSGMNGQNGALVTGEWRDEREALLMEILECQRRIQVISQEALEWELSKQEYDQKIQQLQQQLDDAKATRAACDKLKLQRYNKKRKTSVLDLRGPTPPHEHLDDPKELMLAFRESERQYVNSLTVLDTQYQQPMKMLSAFKHDILSLQQLQFLFLNCSELLNLHRYLLEEMSRVQFLPSSVQLDQFFAVLERIFPHFSLYNPFLDGSRQQNVQKELRALRQKQEFVQLLEHCDKKHEGADLQQLLTLPCERLNEYSKLLTVFLSPKLRGISDESVKRADTLIRFIRTMKYELQDEKSDWDHTLEKIKLLQKLDPNYPVPLEIFDANTRLIKQGQLNQVMPGDKEVRRSCLLFSNYMALAEADNMRILEHGMIPLCGAQLHKTVDIEGQPLTADLKSGRGEDLLGFRVSFVNNESLYFRVAKPNLRKAWVEALEMCIQESHQDQQHEADDFPLSQLYPDVGPKIAAASLEKLFQQLTSPHNFQDDFMEVFLMTHLSFTTSRDVLEALINCMKSPCDGSSHMSADAVFTFSMESETAESEHLFSTSLAYSDTDQFSLNSPVPSRALSTSSPCKKSSSMRTSISTSDSDVSPHTSTVVENGILQNGWTGADTTLKIPPGSKRGSSGDSELDYVMFFRSSRHSSEMDFGDNEDSGQEENADTPRPSLTDTTASRARDKAKKACGDLGTGRVDAEVKISETSIEEEEENCDGEGKNAENGDQRGSLSRSQRMNRDLDETSLMLEKLTQSLCFPVEERVTVNSRDGAARSEGVVVARSGTSDVGVVKRVHRDWQQSRQSTVSASISEPDLTQIGITQSLPLPPKKTEQTQPPIPVPGRRPGTPTNKMTNSLSQCQNLSPSPFLHGTAMMSPTHKKGMLVNGGPLLHSVEESISPSHKQKSKSGERGMMSPFRKRSSMKNESLKSEMNKRTEASTIPARFGKKMPSLTKSSSAYFPNSSVAENGTKLQKSGRGMGVGAGLKGIWKRNSRKKTSVKVSESDEWVDVGGTVEHSPARELPRRMSLKRNNSVAGDKLDSLTEGTRSPLHPRRASSSTGRNGPISLVTKIFQVLDYWQDVHFEDFGEDVTLTQMLESFLRGLLVRSCSDSKEALLGQKLLDDVTSKASHYSTDHSFAALLTRTYRLDLDVVKHFTVSSRQKQPVCRDIDLSRAFSKDSKENMLKVIAEQMTLMEFAVYEAVKRRELMHLNWKTRDREEKAPNVCHLIRRTNEMTSWVCTEILMRDSPSSRATVIEHFIQIALYCYRHNDLHCSLNITFALSSSIIRGLRKTWEEVDKKFHEKFKKLRELADHQGRCKKLREKLEKTTWAHVHKTGEIPAALPYIGAYLDQIYSLEMCTKTYNKDNLVNFTKMTKLAHVVARMLMYQKTRFKFEPKLDVIAYMTSAKRLSENDLYELSCQIEPTSKS